MHKLNVVDDANSNNLTLLQILHRIESEITHQAADNDAEDVADDERAAAEREAENEIEEK